MDNCEKLLILSKKPFYILDGDQSCLTLFRFR